MPNLTSQMEAVCRRFEELSIRLNQPETAADPAQFRTRKQHPCGAASFEVLRVGMDFKIRCTGCGREVMLPRAKIEKNIKKVIKPGQE